MHLVVDGMNVIGSRPDGWWRDREAASRRLVDRCERLVRADGAEVTVVFDGHPRDDPSEDEHTGVRVLYATRRGPDAADDSIVELVASAERSEELRVVTSDRELRRQLGQQRLRVEVESFLGKRWTSGEAKVQHVGCAPAMTPLASAACGTAAHLLGRRPRAAMIGTARRSP